MPVLSLKNLVKAYGGRKVVDSVTLNVDSRSVVGLLGPNGAGKTTIIRLMLDIFQPECGLVTILGGPMDEAKKDDRQKEGHRYSC